MHTRHRSVAYSPRILYRLSSKGFICSTIYVKTPPLVFYGHLVSSLSFKIGSEKKGKRALWGGAEGFRTYTGRCVFTLCVHDCTHTYTPSANNGTAAVVSFLFSSYSFMCVWSLAVVKDERNDRHFPFLLRLIFMFHFSYSFAFITLSTLCFVFIISFLSFS